MPPRLRLPSGSASSLLHQSHYATAADQLLASQFSRLCIHQTRRSSPRLQQQTRGIRSIMKPPPKPNRFDTSLGLSPAALSKTATLARKTYTIPHRAGVLARKKGMSSVMDPTTGHRCPVTILQLDRVQCVGQKTLSKHGYWAVQMGFGYRHPSNLTRPELGHLAKMQVSPKEEVQEFRVKGEEGLLPVGALLGPSWFKKGQKVDVQAKSKGHGFTGGMKQHGWSGQPASHGQSLTHRVMGSAGGSQGSGSRVIPGKRMAGRFGHTYHTVQNLQVVSIDEVNGLIAVKGNVPGPKKCLVRVQDAKKMPWQVGDLGLPVVVEEGEVFMPGPIASSVRGKGKGIDDAAEV